MSIETHIRISMPDLSPEAAYALSEWVAELAQEVDQYYALQIRAFLREQEEDMRQLREQQLQRQAEGDEWDDDVDF